MELLTRLIPLAVVTFPLFVLIFMGSKFRSLIREFENASEIFLCQVVFVLTNSCATYWGMKDQENVLGSMVLFALSDTGSLGLLLLIVFRLRRAK